MKLNFKKYIDKSNLTQTKIAELTGLSFPTINSLYKGSSKSIYFDTLEKLCDILQCTPNDLLEIDSNIHDNKRESNARLLQYKNMLNQSLFGEQLTLETITTEDGNKFLVPCIPIEDNSSSNKGDE